MMPTLTRTPEGDAATAVVVETFRANGLLLASGHRLAAQEGLTAARWQVLGALALAGRPLTVPQIARRMGLTRQAVQASVNRLVSEALAEAGANLDHRRSPLIRLNELAAGLEISDLATAARLLHEISDRLEKTGPTDQKET